MFAQRNEMREANSARLRPVQHGCHERARLRHKSQLAGQRARVGKAGVQTQVRRELADAVRAEDAQQGGPGRVQHGLLLRCIQPGG